LTVTYKQGDQIGRIFAQWVIVYFGCCFGDACHILRILFPPSSLCIIFDKNVLGYILDDFFTNSALRMKARKSPAKNAGGNNTFCRD
jgi:hypothetical protein